MPINSATHYMRAQLFGEGDAARGNADATCAGCRSSANLFGVVAEEPRARAGALGGAGGPCDAAVVLRL